MHFNLQGCFSKTGEESLHFDKRNLRYLSLPSNWSSEEVHFNLAEGYETFRRNESAGSGDIEPLLKWIIHDYTQNQTASADIVCKRGMLRQLATSRKGLNEWRVCGAKMGGTLYLREYETEEKREAKKAQEETIKKMNYWGHKFEQYVTSATRGCVPDTSVPVDANVEFALVMKATLGSLSLLYSGETDCVDDAGNYIELKTNKYTEGVANKFTVPRYKKTNTWFQCYLMGINSIVTGFRGESGNVIHIEKCDVAEWKPRESDEYLDHLETLLKRFQAACTEEFPCVYEFTWNSKQEMQCREHVGPQHDFRFLSDEYVQHVQSRSEAPAAGTAAAGRQG